MDSFHEKLKKIKTFIFDVDGVLSKDTLPLDSKGEPGRSTNLKDGYAIRVAISEGFNLVVITGGRSANVKMRYRKLGVIHYFDNIEDKLESLRSLIKSLALVSEEILYMGDDLVDFKAMEIIGIPACPADAVPEIKMISKYISSKKGGEGCVRDVIEMVLKAQDKWDGTGSNKLKAI